jgi:hypothetical protein
MVLLNVAATRGPAALWPGYRMRNFAPALTLRAVAEMLLPHDHAEISRVEGRPKMADAVVTDVTGALDCGVGDIYQMGVSAVKFFLKFEDVVEPPPVDTELKCDIAGKPREMELNFYSPPIEGVHSASDCGEGKERQESKGLLERRRQW